MRRALASLLLSLSLVFATISWSGFIMTRTVFDPGRSERLADELLDNEEVRAVVIDRLAETINNTIPPEVSISDEQLETAAGLVLDDPRVEQLVKEQLVLAHQNALNGVDEPVEVDATVVGQAGRDAAVAQQPSLDAVLPAVPPVEITLPTTGLSWLGTVNDYVRRISLFSGLIAVAGIAVSLVITSNRPRVLRRLAYWAFGAAAFWIVAAFLAPWIVNLISPSSMVLVTAAINVFFEAMITPAIVMAVFGAVLFGISVFLPRLAKQQAAARVQSRPRRRVPAGYESQRSQPVQPARRRVVPHDDPHSQPSQLPQRRDPAFDNQRLQREVEASRSAAHREFFDVSDDGLQSGYRSNYQSGDGSSSRAEDDWFGSPTDQSAATLDAEPHRAGPWDDSPTVRQPNS